MNDRIASISRSLMDSYHELGGINHLSGPNLPSKQGVMAIIEDLESLVFPGFKTENAIDHGSLQFIVSENVNRLIRNLSVEITRSLCYARRIGNQEADGHCALASNDRLMVVCRKEAETLATELAGSIPDIRARIHKDVEAAFTGDPAAKSREEVILSYPGVEAITIQRLAHRLWDLKIPLLPRMMTEVVHSRTGIDIHPGATIGEFFHIDHGTGVVIGETCVIGNNVKIFQGVTLGAAVVKKNESDTKRHPTLEDDVTVYAGATILGGRTVIGRGSIIGGNVWLTDSVVAGSRVYIKDPEHIIRNSFDKYIDFQI
jgi:serine O-acetyltransferase